MPRIFINFERGAGGNTYFAGHLIKGAETLNFKLLRFLLIHFVRFLTIFISIFTAVIELRLKNPQKARGRFYNSKIL